MAFSNVNTAYRGSATAGLALFTNRTNQVGQLHMVKIVAAAADATATVYDNATTNSGTVLAVLAAKAGTSDEVDHYGDLQFTAGLWIVLTGAGAQLIATWE